jgi:hypothetical protein
MGLENEIDRVVEEVAFWLCRFMERDWLFFFEGISPCYLDFIERNIQRMHPWVWR